MSHPSPPDALLSFPAPASSDLGLKAFMILHAASLAAIIFAGELGVLGVSTPRAMAMAAIVATVLALGLTVIVHRVIRSRRRGPADPDILRLTPDGLEGRALSERGIHHLPWSRLTSVSAEEYALELNFSPFDLSSPNPADRISKIRVPAGPLASAADMAKAVNARLKAS